MPLSAYVAESMRLLGDPHPPGGEVLVQRVLPLRRAVRDGDYDQRFAAMNPGD